MTAAPVLPGTDRDEIRVGSYVWADTHLLHEEWDGTPAGGIVHALGPDELGVILAGVKGWPGGLRHTTLPITQVHTCPGPCTWTPHPAQQHEIRYVVRRLYALIHETHGRLLDHDRRLEAIALTLLEQGLL